MKTILTILIVLIIFSLIGAAKQNNCEQIAKDYQIKYNTQLVWIQYIDSNGAYIFDDKNGAHIINSKIIKGKRYYFDFSIQSYDSRIFNSKEDVSNFYKETTGYNNEVYIVDIDNIPFSIHWDN